MITVRGLRVNIQPIGCEHPEDVATTSFDDVREVAMCRTCSTPWSSVKLRGTEYGR